MCAVAHIIPVSNVMTLTNPLLLPLPLLLALPLALPLARCWAQTHNSVMLHVTILILTQATLVTLSALTLTLTSRASGRPINCIDSGRPISTMTISVIIVVIVINHNHIKTLRGP